MKKLCKKLNHTLFDVATGPFVLMLIGIPLLIVILVILLIWVSIVLIRKAYLKSQQDGKADTGVNTGADADTGTGDAETGVNNTGTGVADTGVDNGVDNGANTIAGSETVDNIDKNDATVNKITAANDNTNNDNGVDNGNTGTRQDQ